MLSRRRLARRGSVRRAPTRSRATTVAAPATPRRSPTPNELGRIPVFEYHLIVDKNGLYERTHDGLRRDLETMYARGYRPISIVEMVDKKIDLASRPVARGARVR